MDRHRDWAAIICLVGGGQKINDGEAGISAWLSAVTEKFPHWRAYISPDLHDSEFAAENAIATLAAKGQLDKDENLHLSVSMRSFRSENLSRLVKAILDRDVPVAKELHKQVSRNYPILLTRNLSVAKSWIRSHARGTERYGMVAASGAQRLKPYAIDVRFNIRPKDWFLNGPTDTRSSWYLEYVATEFHIQGLELDWVLMT